MLSAQNGPINARKRLESYTELGLTNLKIFIPEVHDWILFKTARADEKDIVDIKSAAKGRKSDSGVLLSRFKDEFLPNYSGRDSWMKDRYLLMIEELFGEKVALRHREALIKD